MPFVANISFTWAKKQRELTRSLRRVYTHTPFLPTYAAGIKCNRVGTYKHKIKSSRLNERVIREQSKSNDACLPSMLLQRALFTIAKIRRVYIDEQHR